MTWFNRQLSVHCTVCPQKCSWRDHEQIKEKQIFTTHKETQTVDLLTQDYIQDQTEKCKTVTKIVMKKWYKHMKK